MTTVSSAKSLIQSGSVLATVRNRFLVQRGLPPRLLSHPVQGRGGASARRINALYRGMPSARSYLEIGLFMGQTFQHVEVPIRVGVDPVPLFDLDRVPRGARVFPVTSDAFFAGVDDGTTFDIVFLDGLHTYRQTYTDLINSLTVCPAGVVLIDDVVPSDEVSAMPDQTESLAERDRRGLGGKTWHGDVFKMMLCLRDHHPELSIRTIVGSGNPQALVWRSSPGTSSTRVDNVELDAYADVSYTDVFVDGPPDYFAPCSEAAAVRAAIQGVSG